MNKNIEISSLWRIITMGNGNLFEKINSITENKTWSMSKWEYNLWDRAERKNLESVVELGIIKATICGDPIVYKDLCDHVLGQGKGLCPQTAALEFCWQYPNWNEKNCFKFAAVPVIDEAGHSVIFRIETDKIGNRQICSQIAHDKFRCYPGETYLFTETLKTLL